ncbi:MAG: TonB C-terminal domain-containing protein [Thermodesulfovibrionales bacterium]
MLLFFQTRVFIKERERFITVGIYVDKEISVPSLGINAGVEKAYRPEVVETPGTSRLIPKEISKDTLVEERIHAIKAKKKIEKLLRLRAEIGEMVSRKAETGEQKSKNRAQTQEHSESGSVNKTDYSDIAKAPIQRNWHYPELAKKGLSATVIIYVRKDGAIKIIDFKTSGDRLFDYSVKNAILKSSPLPPPPEECEIQLRFSR